MSTHNTFLWRNKQNYPLIITKCPPYLFLAHQILINIVCPELYVQILSIIMVDYVSHVTRKTCQQEFATRLDLNWPAQPQTSWNLEILDLQYFL